MTPAELWEQYQPRFDEAKLQDKCEQTLVFLVQPVRVGRFWIAPLTIRRVLYLDAYQNPFVGGTAPVSRWNLLELFWVLNPNFVPSAWRRKVFFARHCTLNVERYAVDVGELLEGTMELMSGSGKEEDCTPLWVAQLIDVYASQYGWGLKEILDTPFVQLHIMGKALRTRMAMSSGSPDANVEHNRNSDKLRSEYLKEANQLTNG